MAAVKKPQSLSSLQLADQFIAEPVSLSTGQTAQANPSITSVLTRRIPGQGGELVSLAGEKSSQPAFFINSWLLRSY